MVNSSELKHCHRKAVPNTKAKETHKTGELRKLLGLPGWWRGCMNNGRFAGGEESLQWSCLQDVQGAPGMWLA